MMASSLTLSSWKIPGHFERNGVVYFDRVVSNLDYDIADGWKADPRDLLIASYPKTGTTWVSKIASCLLQRPDQSQEVYLELRKHKDLPAAAECYDQFAAPRFFLTHLTPDFLTNKLADNVKTILVFRNPKDALVSFYHMHKIDAFGNYPGSFDDFFEMFKSKRLLYGDFFDWCRLWWQKKDLPNVHIVKYEDMVGDCAQTVLKMASFLECNVSEEQVEDILRQCSLGEMRSKAVAERKDVTEKDLKLFFRKGGVGGWKDHFSKEQDEFMDKLIREHLNSMGLFLNCG